MKYVPKQLDEEGNVNVTKRRPLKDLVVMLGGVLGIILAVYVLAGLLVDALAPHISRDLEVKMGRLFSRNFCAEETWADFPGLDDGDESHAPDDGQKKPEVQGETSPDKSDDGALVKEILAKYVALLSEEDRLLDYRVCVVDVPDVNALALPGGQIVVFQGLIDTLEDPAELEFVIAHELGHFHARDHLKGLGRSLITLAASILLLGNDSVATDFIFDSAGTIEMKFSQGQELAADAFALNLVSRAGVDCDGAIDFMQSLADEDRFGKLAYYFATHPHPDSRKQALLKLARKSQLCAEPIDGPKRKSL